MKRVKRLVRALLSPPPAITAACVPLAAAALAWVFLSHREAGPAAYTAYAFSFYTLVIVLLRLCPALGRAKGRALALAEKNPHIRRYRTDPRFKTVVSLLRSLSLNLLYAAVKLVSGLYYGSAWLITLAAYYALLTVMRFLLFTHLRQGPDSLAAEWRRCRLCGAVLALMNIVLTGMIILVLRRDEGYSYGGMLIYAMALYDFFIIITASVNLVKSRRHNSPVLSAARAVSLASALISMLSLETAMLSRFGGPEDDAFRHGMVAATGGVIAGALLAMAAYMIAAATKHLKNDPL